MRTALISHPDTLLHMMDGSHPESPARITAIKNQLTKTGLIHKLKLYEAPTVSRAELQRVHTSAYLSYIHTISPKAGLVRLDADTAMGPMSLSACLHASGAAILATDLVISKKTDNAFCCVRPPGHHAGKENAAGFCIFNHIAVGVAHALAHHKLARVAIIDFDVHHGDGTESIFKDDPRVMLCSTFQHPFYPHRGADSRSDRMINVPLAAQSNGDEIKKVFESEFAPAIARFKPEMIFVSAGFDAHAADPLADLRLEKEDYRWITRWILDKAKLYANNRVVSLLEGGYHLPSLAESVEAHIHELAS